MSFVSLTDSDREGCSGRSGGDSVEQLFADRPECASRRELDVAPALSELELGRTSPSWPRETSTRAWSSHSSAPASTTTTCPPWSTRVVQRGELLTAYTPYQPEMSQGTLQAIFEYQTAICELTGMDVSNASGYDGTTVAADACLVARRRPAARKVVVTETLNPQVREVVRTFAPGFGMEVVQVPHTGGATDPAGRGRPARARPA